MCLRREKEEKIQIYFLTYFLAVIVVWHVNRHWKTHSIANKKCRCPSNVCSALVEFHLQTYSELQPNPHLFRLPLQNVIFLKAWTPGCLLESCSVQTRPHQYRVPGDHPSPRPAGSPLPIAALIATGTFLADVQLAVHQHSQDSICSSICHNHVNAITAKLIQFKGCCNPREHLALEPFIFSGCSLIISVLSLLSYQVCGKS